MAEVIREATKSDFHLLREFLETKLPSSMSVLLCIEMAVTFEVTRKIYVTGNDPTLFIFVCDFYSTHPTFSVFWDRDRVSKEETKMYLKSVPWDWEQSFKFCRMDSALALELNRMILENELSLRKFQVTQHIRCFNFKMDPDLLPETECPKGFKLGKLKPHHASLLMATWKFSRGKNIQEYIECIKQLPTAAVYKDEDKEDENPVSWSILLRFGAMGMTHTLPQFRRLGLAKAVTVHLCRKLIANRFPINAEVEIDNKQSIDMLKKIGFQIIGQIEWVMYHPED